jgi:flavin-dependent dehydrogenase
MLKTADTEYRTRAQCDVLVIGGGPAGSTVSALLAERGREAALVS